MANSTIVRRTMLNSRYFLKAINTAYLSTSPYLGNKKAAVIFSGCGVYDGSEIHEASSSLIHLSRSGAEVTMFAPDVKQMHVIDHTTGDLEVNIHIV